MLRQKFALSQQYHPEQIAIEHGSHVLGRRADAFVVYTNIRWSFDMMTESSLATHVVS